jgi:hypothetical protein
MNMLLNTVNDLAPGNKAIRQLLELPYLEYYSASCQMLHALQNQLQSVFGIAGTMNQEFMDRIMDSLDRYCNTRLPVKDEFLQCMRWLCKQDAPIPLSNFFGGLDSQSTIFIIVVELVSARFSCTQQRATALTSCPRAQLYKVISTEQQSPDNQMFQSYLQLMAKVPLVAKHICHLGTDPITCYRTFRG